MTTSDEKNQANLEVPVEHITDATPSAVNHWWRSLDDEQRGRLASTHPQEIGACDGIPARVRDTVNRTVLPRTDARTSSLCHRLDANERRPPVRHLHLIAITASGRGKAIVAVGNPDVAPHIAVIVPGMNTSLCTIDFQLDQAETLQRTADDLITGPPGDVSAIAWLGYQSPTTIGALRSGAAKRGAPALYRFVEGLRACHETDQCHITVVGHSYGSVVVGHAASSGPGLAADDLIITASPGMDVDNVHQLRIEPRHVWTGAAPGDLISRGIGRFIHNTEPHRDEFGANRYVTRATYDGAYWKPDVERLRNQARIVVGFYDRVSLEHGSPPV